MVGGLLGGVAGGATVLVVIRAVDKFTKPLKLMTAKLGKFGKFLKVGVIAAVLATAVAFIALGKAMQVGISESIKLETAMVGVAKTTGLAGEDLKELELGFRELSKTIPITSTELANIGAVAGQLGIEGAENIKNFTEVAAKMAIATELTAEDAALALAKISNAFSLPIEDVEELGSAINELSNVSAASSSEIVSAMVRAAGAAADLGISAEVVAGLSAALIAAGEPAERAGTKLRSAFDQMLKKLKETSDFMGIDFKKALEEDASGAIIALITKISEIESPVERQLLAMELFGTVGKAAISKLSSNIPEMTRLIAISAGEFENATSLQKEFDIASESTANQIQLLKNRFTELLLTAFQPLLPVVGKIIDFFGKLIDKATQFAETNGPFFREMLVKIGEALKEGFNVVDTEAFFGVVSKVINFIKDNKEEIISTFKNFAKFVGQVFNIFVKLISLLITSGALTFILLAFSTLSKIINIIADTISFVVDKVKSLVEFLSEAIRLVASIINTALSGFGLGKAIFKLFGLGDDEIPQLAHGGIVTKPTLALIGEAGPEAVVPLSKSFGSGGLGGSNINIFIEGTIVSETEMVESIGEALQNKLNVLQKAF